MSHSFKGRIIFHLGEAAVTSALTLLLISVVETISERPILSENYGLAIILAGPIVTLHCNALKDPILTSTWTRAICCWFMFSMSIPCLFLLPEECPDDLFLNSYHDPEWWVLLVITVIAYVWKIPQGVRNDQFDRLLRHARGIFPNVEDERLYELVSMAVQQEDDSLIKKYEFSNNQWIRKAHA